MVNSVKLKKRTKNIRFKNLVHMTPLFSKSPEVYSVFMVLFWSILESYEFCGPAGGVCV